MGHLYLIGYMGTGKSSVGRVLAQMLKRAFIDLDERIESSTGKRIPEIFRTEGESGFRKRESETLAAAVKEEEAVIACGGGTPCFHENLRIMKESGTLVHLTAEPSTVLQRTQKATQERPRIQGMGEEEIRTHMEERWPCYEEADIRIETDRSSPERSAEKILDHYSK
jgi:shikimate kinase